VKSGHETTKYFERKVTSLSVSAGEAIYREGEKPIAMYRSASNSFLVNKTLSRKSGTGTEKMCSAQPIA
jgi:hypothetical protein